MSDIVERLREGCGCNYPETTCMAESECRDAFEAADEIERLRAALRNVMIGGNHLAQVLGIGHLAAGSSYETALEFYGPGPNYDVWCCWNAIMEARAALKESGDE